MQCDHLWELNRSLCWHDLLRCNECGYVHDGYALCDHDVDCRKKVEELMISDDVDLNASSTASTEDV